MRIRSRCRLRTRWRPSSTDAPAWTRQSSRCSRGHSGPSMDEEATMAHWLLKTEPESYSWDELIKKGAKGDVWSGVRNHIAKSNLKKMKKGERVFFYHTGDEK